LPIPLEGSGQWATKYFIGKQLGAVGSFFARKNTLAQRSTFFGEYQWEIRCNAQKKEGTFGFEIRDANQKSFQKQPTFQEPVPTLRLPRVAGEKQHGPESNKQSVSQASYRVLPTKKHHFSSSKFKKSPQCQSSRRIS
jgi:hypothetical protein